MVFDWSNSIMPMVGLSWRNITFLYFVTHWFIFTLLLAHNRDIVEASQAWGDTNRRYYDVVRYHQHLH